MERKGARGFLLKLLEQVTDERRYSATRKWEIKRKRKGERNLLVQNEDAYARDEKIKVTNIIPAGRAEKGKPKKNTNLEKSG